METRSKRKAAKKNGLDYISRLPDDLLIYILSFLSVIEAAKTCLVAKRWRTLLAQGPDLYLDSEDFNSEDQFVNCVTSKLKHRGTDQRLDVFQLSRETDSEFEFYPPLLKWISRVVKFSPRCICICVCVDFEEFTLPKSLFTCKSLEQLVVAIEIAYSICVDLNTKAIKLPRLKYLKLSFVDINSKDMKNILRGCPMLENLHFESCDLNFSKVSSNTLKGLFVDNCDLNNKEIQFPFLVLNNSI